MKSYGYSGRFKMFSWHFCLENRENDAPTATEHNPEPAEIGTTGVAPENVDAVIAN